MSSLSEIRSGAAATWLPRVLLVCLLPACLVCSTAHALLLGRWWFPSKPIRPTFAAESRALTESTMHSAPDLQALLKKSPSISELEAWRVKPIEPIAGRPASAFPEKSALANLLAQPYGLEHLRSMVLREAPSELARRLADKPHGVLQQIDADAAAVVTGRSAAAVRRTLVPAVEFGDTVSIAVPTLLSGNRREEAQRFAALVAVAIMEEALPNELERNVDPARIKAGALAAIRRADAGGIGAIGSGGWVGVLSNEFASETFARTVVTSHERLDAAVDIDISNLSGKSTATIDVNAYAAAVAARPNEPNLKKVQRLLASSSKP